MSDTQFKISMRGYDRDMVDSYIARIHGEYSSALAEQQKKADEAQQGRAELVRQLADKETLCTEMQTTLASAQEFINAQTQKLNAAQRDVDDLRRKNALYLDKQEALTRLLADAQVKCAKLVEEAQHKAAKIVEEAQQEGEALVDKARASAANMIAESKRDADAVQTEMHQRFITIQATVDAIRQMTGQIVVCCDATDQMIADPESFFYSQHDETVTN